jgi:hypothetical protein
MAIPSECEEDGCNGIYLSTGLWWEAWKKIAGKLNFQKRHSTNVGGLVQVVEHLPSKHEALSSSPSSSKTQLKRLLIKQGVS